MVFMIIIRTNWSNFEEYIKSLGKSTQKNHHYVEKHNKDLEYNLVPFNKIDVERFMQIWERQLVYNRHIKWVFGINHVQNLANKNELLVFEARKKRFVELMAHPKSEVLAMHFIQRRIGYWECHPPMYDKIHNERYLGKYMWFSLFKYSIENKLEHMDIGGFSDDWVKNLKDRPRTYKWIYVPESDKKQPDKQPRYFRQEHNGTFKLSKVPPKILFI